MIILVSGYLCLADEKERQFSQVFNIVKVGDSYAIKNDMLHINEIPEALYEEVIEEPEVEPEAQPEVEVEP